MGGPALRKVATSEPRRPPPNYKTQTRDRSSEAAGGQTPAEGLSFKPQMGIHFLGQHPHAEVSWGSSPMLSVQASAGRGRAGQQRLSPTFRKNSEVGFSFSNSLNKHALPLG